MSTQVFSAMSTSGRTATLAIPLWLQAVAQSGARISTAGTFSNLRAYSFPTPGAGNTWVVTLRTNSVNRAITCTIDGTSGQTSCTDTSNTFTSAANDIVDISFAATGTPTAATLFFSVQWSPTTAGETVMFSAVNGVSSTLSYAAVNAGTNQTVQVNAQQLFPVAGTLKNLYAIAGAPGGATSYTFTAQDGGVNTTLESSIVGAGGTGIDLTHAVSVLAGDLMNFLCTPAGGPTARGVTLGSTFVPSTVGDFVWGSTFAPSTAVVRFISPSTFCTPAAAESSVVSYTDAMTVKSFYVNASASPGAAKTYTYDLRKNSSSIIATCSISGTSTSCSAVGTTTLLAGDSLSIQITPVGSPAASTQFSAVVLTATSATPSSVVSMASLLPIMDVGN